MENCLRETQFTHNQLNEFSLCGDSEKDEGCAARTLADFAAGA